MKIRNYQLDSFTTAYLVCALWSSRDESDDKGGEPMDSNYSLHDISDKTLEQAIADCARFQTEAGELISDENYKRSDAHNTTEIAGHDFWLTRNGHGAGFWDGDWNEPAASKLDALADSFHEVDLYIGDDGMVHA